MKKIFFTGAFAFISLISFSQTAKVAPAATSETVTKDKGAREELINSLNLTEDQKSKFKEATKAGKDAKTAIENDNTLSEDQKKEKMKALRETQNAKYKAFMTPEQYEKFQSGKKAGKEDKKQ